MINLLDTISGYAPAATKVNVPGTGEIRVSKDKLRSNVGLSDSPPLGLFSTAVLFGSGGLLLWIATRIGVPWLSARTGAESVVLWFLAAGVGVFVPLLLLAGAILYQEGALWRPNLWSDRLRFRRMTAGDWVGSFGALVAIGLSVAGLTAGLRWGFGEVRLHPTFMSMTPLTPGRYWILLAWLPFWVLNILSEEILWRGVILPRQVTAWGRWAWLVHGAAWLIFHIPFGPVLLLVLAPTTFLLPYVVQHRQNSWIGVVIHAGLNGPGFIAVAFGLA